jgi:MSHA biogenesis protein MshP
MIIIAVFVIVVMGMLALSLGRLQWSNQDTLTREILGARAWFLAHSGNEWALTRMFPLDQEENNERLTERCGRISTASGSDAVAAAEKILSGTSMREVCSGLAIQCRAPKSTVPDKLKFYQIVSTVTCGSGKYQVKRSQEVWVKGVER